MSRSLQAGDQPLPSNGASINDDDGPAVERQDEEKTQSDGIQKLPFFMVSLVLVCLGVSSKFHATLVDQYLYQRFANDIIGNATHTASDPCFHGPESNDSVRALVTQVQNLTSEKLLLLDLVLFGLGVPSCVVLGILSRTIGRRLQLMIPLFGYTFKCAGIVAMVYMEPDPNWFFLPYAVEGVSGAYVGILLGLFLYTSDISGRSRSRTTAMLILEGVKGATTAALNVLVGDLIEKTGFKLCSWFSLGAAAAAFLVIFVLPDRKPPTNQVKAGSSNVQDGGPSAWRTWFSMFLFPAGTFDNPNVKKLFISAYTAAFLYMTAAMGVKKVQSLYLMNEPICWAASIIGWFSFGGEMSANLFTIFIGPFLIRWFPGMVMGILGLISLAGGCVFLALATRGFELYFQPIVTVGARLPMGLIRGELSRLVGPESQGVLFATIAVMESLAFAIGANFLYVYNATLSVYKGTMALLGAALLLSAALMLIFFHRVWLRHYRDYQKLQNMATISDEKNGRSSRA